MITQRRLGKEGPWVGSLGYGAMVLEGYYGPSDEKEAIQTIHHALELGMNMIDSADAYGNGHNESLLAKAVAGKRDQAFLATKFGIVFDPGESGRDVPTGWGFSLKINGEPAYVKKALRSSLARLNAETIDLWYLHYTDPSVPIEETVGAMAGAVKEGKVRHLGLSNCTADQLRRAHKVHPISAVQYEYSLWRREAESDLLPTCRELGIAFVPWSPLGGGFLTGTLQRLDANDFRNNNPRFQGNNLSNNQKRFEPLTQLALELKVSPAQLALAWLLHQDPLVIPIPGTRRRNRLDENAKAAELTINAATLEKMNTLFPQGLARGATLL